MSEQLLSEGSEGGLFDEIKMVNEFGADYWSARDLMPRLGYAEWRNFSHAVERARTACQQSGNDPANHFVDDNKMIPTGKGATRQVKDVHLSRFACYLIAQNGDPQNPEIAKAQRYFAIQARRQELGDAAVADRERVTLRDRCTGEFKALSGVASQVGVNAKNFGIFHDAGYKGLYGGLGNDAIKKRKGIPKKEVLMDRMGTTELAANAFRLTQAREQLLKGAVSSERQAIVIHERVGREVRDAIERIGGTMPEDLKPAEHIKEAKKRLKSAVPQIELASGDAKGLTAAQEDPFADI